MTFRPEGNRPDPDAALLHLLRAAVKTVDAGTVTGFQRKYGDSTLVAHDLPHPGDRTIVQGTALRILVGSSAVGVGFLTEASPDEPLVLNPEAIGRLAVVHDVESIPESIQ